MSNMVKAVQHGKEELSLAMLWLAAYTFLLRLPSEVRMVRPLYDCLTCLAFDAGTADVQGCAG